MNGSTPDSENPCFWNGDIVWITPTDLGKLAEPYIRNSDREITKAGFDSRNLTRVPSRSVVLSSRAPIGHLGIAAVLRDQMASVEKARAAAEEELQTLNALPAALLRRAFAGEL